MLNSNELFSVIEFAPVNFGRNKQSIFHHSLTLVLQKTVETGRAPSLLFFTSPGFCPSLPEPDTIETIIQIAFSDRLVDLFHFYPLAFIGKFVRRSSNCRFFLQEALMQQVIVSMVELKQKSGYESFEKILHLMYILASADDTETLKEEPALSLCASHIADKINKVKNYIKVNLRNQIKIGEVAEISGFSICHFSRFFKQYTGMSFIAYVNLIRIEEATLLLLKTDDSISGIAYSCGFNTPHYFNEIFKRYKRKTPGELRIEN